jgi:5-methylcytosine-specific restriction endonuclease McrA
MQRPALNDPSRLLAWAYLQGFTDSEIEQYRTYARGGPVPKREQSRELAQRRRISDTDRADVLAPGTLCAYCEIREADTVDHAIPVARGGTSDRSNLAPACWPCNYLKSAGVADDEFREKMRELARLWESMLDSMSPDSPLARRLAALMSHRQ